MNLQKHNLLAVGCSGCDRNLLQVQPVSEEIGYVGEVNYVETALLKGLINMGYIPVIAPIGVNGNEIYNINADNAAAWDCGRVRGKRADFITDVDGILHEGNLVKETDESEIATFIETGVITGGMIPKVQATSIIKMGVQKISIVNGTKDFTEVTGECIGTTVTKGVSIA